MVDAVRCAVEVQRAMPERDTGIGADNRIELRIGINLGDVRGCPWLRSKACRPVDQCLPSGGDFEDAKGYFERQTGSPDFSK